MPYWPLGGNWLTIHRKNWIVYCGVVNVPVFESGGGLKDWDSVIMSLFVCVNGIIGVCLKLKPSVRFLKHDAWTVWTQSVLN